MSNFEKLTTSFPELFKGVFNFKEPEELKYKNEFKKYFIFKLI
jgi:hypothetical protein